MRRKDKYNLHHGDQVSIDGTIITIGSIQYFAGDVVRIMDTDGNTYECFIDEIK